MDSPATYLHWGFILISVPNFLVIVAMIVLFTIALVAPFPHHDEGDDVSNR
jgi:large-conductance mechanosensitive channel